MFTDDEGLSAEEKIKQLIEFENDKRKELEEKKSELEKRKKELETLEETRNKEIASARKRIEEKIEELAHEEKQRFEELEEIRLKREQESKSLEDQVTEEAGKRAPAPAAAPKGYGDVIDEILKGRAGFYEITNYNVINRLESIAQEAGNRPLTKTEKDFMEMVQYHAEQMEKDDFYKNKDGSNYLKRELSQIDVINKTVRERDNKPGEYQL
jgi:hypothetical protein